MLVSGYFYLAIIYLVWGTTYLAMRVGVAPGSGFPAFAFGGSRCLAAAGILLALAALRRQNLRPTRPQWIYLAISGLGMWVFSHGLVLVAEQYLASGFAAVAVATSPLWLLLLNALRKKGKPGLRQSLLVGLGFAGIALLMVPEIQKADSHSALGLLLLIIAPLIWAASALYVQDNPQTLSVFAQSGYQHLFGGLGFWAMSRLFHEPIPAPTPSAWGALAFLIIFGSVIAFTAYIKALSLLPAQVVTTNTYVNPVIAVILGWLLLHEAVTGWTLAAIVLVILSVSGTLRLKTPKASG